MLPPVATLPGILRYAGGYFGRVRVTNNTGSGLPAGHPIYVEGAGGSLLAQEAAGGADLSTHVTLEAIANGQSGWAAAYWDAAGFDVGGSGWSVGDWLYVAAGGGWTTTAPTGVKWRQAAGTVVASDRVLFFPGAALTTWFPAIGDPTSGHVVYGDGDDWLSGTKDSAGIVDKSSDQTIGGKKAFSSAPTVPDLILTGCRIVTSDTTLCDCGTASDPHWHIASDGDDSTGDGTDEAPWLTLEKAMDVISDYVIADGVTLKIVCAAGAYVIGTTKTMAGGPLTVGTGKVEIYGDSATPANVRFTALANNGDTSIDIDEIEDLGGNSFKYWLEGDPDLSAVSTLGRLCAQNCGNPGGKDNNVKWCAITAVDKTNKNVTVTNPNGVAEDPCPGDCVIATYVADSLIKVALDNPTNLWFNGCTFEGCSTQGGIYVERTDPRVHFDNCLFRYNDMGIKVRGAEAHLEDSTVENNKRGLYGELRAYIWADGCSGNNYDYAAYATYLTYIDRGSITGDTGNSFTTNDSQVT